MNPMGEVWTLLSGNGLERAAHEWRRHLGVYYFSCRRRNPPPYLAPNRSLSRTDIHSSIRVFHLPYNGTFFPRGISAERLFNGARKMASQCIDYSVIQKLVHSAKRHRSVLASVYAWQDSDFLPFSRFYLVQKPRRSSSSSSAQFAWIRLSFLPVTSRVALCLLHMR